MAFLALCDSLDTQFRSITCNIYGVLSINDMCFLVGMPLVFFLVARLNRTAQDPQKKPPILVWAVNIKKATQSSCDEHVNIKRDTRKAPRASQFPPNGTPKPKRSI